MKNNGSACLRKYKITEIEERYSSKPEGTIDMDTKWVIKRDNTIRV